VALAVDLVEEYDGDESFLRAMEALLERTDKPVAVLSNLASAVDQAGAARLRAAGIPVLEGTASGLRALGHLLAPPPLPRPQVVVDEARQARWKSALHRSWPDLLADYGISVVPGGLARSREEALRLADEVGRPAVLKTAAPHVHHKTEADGVRLGLADVEAVAAAYDELAGRLGPEVHLQRQVSGVEVALGIVADPLLGPLVVVAAGGTLVELVADRAVALPPVSPETARALVGRLMVSSLLDGFRGSPAADVDALTEVVVALGQLAVELGDHLAGLDLNPVVVGPAGSGQGALVVDALVLPR
jgi:acyl-CoA synthetase (NDP forming)